MGIEDSIEAIKLINPNGLTFITLTIVSWIDLFTRVAFADIVLDSLRYCQKDKGLNVYAYVIMPSHLHLIVNTENSRGLAPIIQSFKSYTAKQILAALKDKSVLESRKDWLLSHFAHQANLARFNRQHQVWKAGYHPFALYSPKMCRQKLHYIHQNPVSARIVAEPTHYLHSSASNYAYGKGILEVILLEDIWNDIGYVG